MTVDGNIHKYLVGKYGEIIELPRYGVKSEDGVVNVEVYLF